jgi:prolyl-tRNA editing enzyme YbaK/EbsC (Cys-tRNA(Pro) deacylase)
MMSSSHPDLSRSAQRVQAALRAQGMELTVQELPHSTRTAVDAAAAVGCAVGQIAKSLLLVTEDGRQPVLVMVSGANRLDESKLGAYLGQKVRMASADEVREMTGFAIGGVPPVGHLEPLRTLIDADLMSYDHIWAAAGTPRAVFRLRPEELVQITSGHVLPVA